MADRDREFESMHDAPLRLLLARRAELLSEVKAITAEVRRRGIARTDNFIGEVGERLVVTVLGGQLLPTSAKDIDLIDGEGRRVQVKVRELPSGVTRRFTFGSLEFDSAVCIRFDRATLALDWGREIDVQTVRGLATQYHGEYRLSESRARSAGRDLTDPLRRAWETMRG